MSNRSRMVEQVLPPSLSDRIELGWVDVQAFGVDDIGVIMREQNLTHDDLPRLAELQRDVATAFERGRRLLDPG